MPKSRHNYTGGKNKMSVKLYLPILGLVMLNITSCSGVPKNVAVNPEFRRQMEGKTIGEATGV